MKRLASLFMVVLAGMGALLCLPPPLWGDAPAPHDVGDEARHDASGAAQPSQPAANGEAVFKRTCATCHSSLKAGDMGGAVPGIRAFPRELRCQPMRSAPRPTRCELKGSHPRLSQTILDLHTDTVETLTG